MRLYKLSVAIVSLVFIAESFSACNQDKSPDPQRTSAISDSGLYELSQRTQYRYYRDVDSTYTAAGDSPHGRFKLRFNRIAFEALGADGKLPSGRAFPDCSLVLKEIYDNGTLTVVVPMLKMPTDSNAGQGWVWGEYFADGRLIHTVKNQGQGCIHCHTRTPNRDFIRSFDLH